LQCADRRAVVAELGVVVVLQHPSAPRAQGGAALGREHHAGRVLVRRRDQHRLCSAAHQRIDVEPLRVDRHRHELHQRRERRAHEDAARLLDREPCHAAREERPAGDHQALGHARGHDDALRRRHDAAHAAEIRGQRAAQLGRAPRVAVAEAGVGRVAQGFAHGRGPGGAREQRRVGLTGHEVVARRARLV
jgi:hypothetical protein